MDVPSAPVGRGAPVECSLNLVECSLNLVECSLNHVDFLSLVNIPFEDSSRLIESYLYMVEPTYN